MKGGQSSCTSVYNFLYCSHCSSASSGEVGLTGVIPAGHAMFFPVCLLQPSTLCHPSRASRQFASEHVPLLPQRELPLIKLWQRESGGDQVIYADGNANTTQVPLVILTQKNEVLSSSHTA